MTMRIFYQSMGPTGCTFESELQRWREVIKACGAKV
jgi:hypothetical protein